MNYHKTAQRFRWREWLREYRKRGGERMGTVSGLRDGGGVLCGNREVCRFGNNVTHAV
jgi:hypothetical protein